MDKHTQKYVGKLSMNCLSVFDHSVNLALKGLKICHQWQEIWSFNNIFHFSTLAVSLSHNKKSLLFLNLKLRPSYVRLRSKLLDLSSFSIATKI